MSKTIYVAASQEVLFFNPTTFKVIVLTIVILGSVRHIYKNTSKNGYCEVQFPLNKIDKSQLVFKNRSQRFSILYLFPTKLWKIHFFLEKCANNLKIDLSLKNEKEKQEILEIIYQDFKFYNKKIFNISTFVYSFLFSLLTSIVICFPTFSWFFYVFTIKENVISLSIVVFLTYQIVNFARIAFSYLCGFLVIKMVNIIQNFYSKD